MALRREDLFRDDGTDALNVCASVPLAYARLALALTDGYGWRYWGLKDEDEALIESGLGALIEAMSMASEGCGMVGQIVTFVSYEALESAGNCLLCDGGEYTQAEYPELYSVMPQEFINRDKFVVPDLSGRFLRGPGFSGGNLFGGNETVELAVNNLPPHTHEYIQPVMTVNLESPGAPDILAAAVGPAAQTGSSGAGEPFSIIPPFMFVVYGIVYK